MVELDADALPTHDGLHYETEFEAPIGPHQELIALGSRRVGASAAEETGTIQVLDGARPLTFQPQHDADRRLGDTIDVYSVASPEPWKFGYARQRLEVRFAERAPAPSPQPKPIGTACGTATIADPPTPDAPPGLDVDTAWFDSDAANLYATMRVRGLPERAAPETTNVYTVSWWHEHVRYRAVARVTASGVRQFRLFAETWVLSHQDMGTISGEIVTGENGLIRFTIPHRMTGIRTGDALRDALARAEIYNGATQLTAPIDHAPSEAFDRYGGGNHTVGRCD